MHYAVIGGTATAGADYKLPAGTVTFSPGQTSKDITLRIVNDKVREPSEKIQIGLSSPVNAVLGTKSVHAYTILDNDTASSGHAAMSYLAADAVFAEMAGLIPKRKLNRLVR